MSARKVDRDEVRALRAQGWKVDDLAARYGCDRSQVSRACKGIKPPVEYRGGPGCMRALTFANKARARLSRERRALCRDLRLRGMTLREIAAITRFSDGQVSRYCAGINVDLRKEPKRAKRVEVPGWVPDWLRPEYEAKTRRDGEEAAASHCRQLKAEARRACA